MDPCKIPKRRVLLSRAAELHQWVHGGVSDEEGEGGQSVLPSKVRTVGGRGRAEILCAREQGSEG